ncbi:hypothetical protein [Chitinophaga sedimenti]|uniref:hypothetical protein n=1 Tax=Chitinophaga sedimenti TaxID=2033606 RepID=UPI003FD7B3F9
MLLFAASACQRTYTPKPRGYFKIPLPEKEYKVFDEPGYPYTFEYPAYGNIVKDTVFLTLLPKIRTGLTWKSRNSTVKSTSAIKLLVVKITSTNW